MSTASLIGQRLIAAAAAPGEFQYGLASLPPPPHWLGQVTCSFKDESGFENVLAFGKAIRATMQTVRQGSITM
jgi:hypothetical protein